MARNTSSPTAPARVRLKPQDSFDLIRLLARSQSDARKALGELVQNSLDAGARHIDITWLSEKGSRALRILDDGLGIFPDMEREQALRRIAETIGHSHKRALSIAERREQMLLGKYGIGLLGFWCVARVMEVKSRAGGGETWTLRLVEDRPEAEVFRARAQRSLIEETFTELTLREVKESVQRQVRPPRLQAYLAAELRGQLLQRGTEVRIHDRIARGRAAKEFVVKPRAYVGRPIEGLRALAVPGHEDARLELYHVPEDEDRHGTVALSCGGTTVLDDVALVDLTDPEGRAREPWASGRFEGVIDFPELDVAPGTRRGFVPNDAALDFLIALEKLEAALREHIAQEEQQRLQARRDHVAREIRRAFAPVARRLPQYDLMDVRARGRAPGEAARGGPPCEPLGGMSPAGAVPTAGDAAATENGSAGDSEEAREPPPDAHVAATVEPPPAGAALSAIEPSAADPAPPAAPPRAADAVHPDAATDVDADADDPELPALFPPGPLVRVRLIPARIRLAPSTERAFRARAEDLDGRHLGEGIALTWRLAGPGVLLPSGARATFRAPDDEGDATLHVEARQGAFTATADAAVQIRDGAAAAERTTGIPEPQPVNAPSEPWRSRVHGARWEYNEGHRDYQSVAADETRRLRYLIHLFAKEVVLRNFGSPTEQELLERMVEVLTHLGDGRARG